MKKKVICSIISLLLVLSALAPAYAVEFKTLKDVCENEKTFEAIKAMTESDELELYVVLKCPEIENISCALQNLSPEEFEVKKNEIYEMYKNFCYKFIEDHSIITPTYCPFSTMFICKLTLKDIENIINDERFERFSILESGIEADNSETDTDYLEDYEADTDSWRNSCDYMGDEIDTDENWASTIDEAGNLIIPGGGTLEVWRSAIEKYDLIYHIDEEDNLIISAESALRYWRGDATMDGTLDMLDVTVTQKYVAKLDTECNTILADMDENGNVNLQDVVQMQKTIANII